MPWAAWLARASLPIWDLVSVCVMIAPPSTTGDVSLLVGATDVVVTERAFVTRTCSEGRCPGRPRTRGRTSRNAAWRLQHPHAKQREEIRRHP
jgi:hypothetical protein